MPIACKICIAERGLWGHEIDVLSQTEEEFFEHVEREHHIPVQRVGETTAQAVARMERLYPESCDPKTCKCPACKRERGDP